MIHERFDIDRFKRLFPLSKLREQTRERMLWRYRESPGRFPNPGDVERHVRMMGPGGERVTGPYEIAMIEQLRDEAGFDELERLPTDLFVFAQGEPADRRVTKVGGLPYWPKQDEWPTTLSGQPLRYIAQFCFSDSRFIFEELPGDLLVIFGDPESYGAEGLQCHWLDADVQDLVSRHDIPNFQEFFPVYGALHRTYDYVTSPSGLDVTRAELVQQIEGTKIGGIPRWVQGAEEQPGTFLCALGSIEPNVSKPYPYINAPDQNALVDREDRQMLTWGDVGSVFFFLDDAGHTLWVGQGY